MATLTLNDDKKFTDTNYSRVIGPKLLRRVKQELGEEVLVQFGFTKTIIDRMVRRGVKGIEIDILSSILISQDMFKLKYIKRRERELMKEVYPTFKDYFFLKPVLMLAMHPESSHRFRGITLGSTGYEDIFWGDKKRRPFLDRTFIYDAMIYMILWLWKQYGKLGKQELDQILYRDFGITDGPMNAQRIFYEYFKDTTIDTERKVVKVRLAKRDNAYGIIKELYMKVIDAFHKQCIGNPEQYIMNASDGKIKDHWNHHLVNFVLHYRTRVWGKAIPNIFLADLNAMSSRLSEPKKAKPNPNQ